MTTPASPDHAEPWYLLGAGNMGLLAAHYLQRAGFTVIALRRDDAPTLERTLLLPSGDRVSVQLLCERAPPAKGAKPRQDPRARSNDSTNNASGIPPAGFAGLSRAGPAPTRPGDPIRRLVVACKAPFSTAALGGLPLAADATVLRLQNGLGSLDGLLPAGARRVEVVSASATPTEWSPRMTPGWEKAPRPAVRRPLSLRPGSAPWPGTGRSYTGPTISATASGASWSATR